MTVLASNLNITGDVIIVCDGHPFYSQSKYEAIMAPASDFTAGIFEYNALNLGEVEHTFGMGRREFLAVLDVYHDDVWKDPHLVCAHRPMFAEDIYFRGYQLCMSLMGEFVEYDLIEDRLEYTVEDFMESYNMSEECATILRNMVHTH